MPLISGFRAAGWYSLISPPRTATLDPTVNRLGVPDLNHPTALVVGVAAANERVAAPAATAAAVAAPGPAHHLAPRAAPVGAQNPVTSCDLHVLV
jgi:hypothetical protein